MTFVPFDTCLTVPPTHSYSSEKDIERLTGLQGEGTNNVEVLLSGAPLLGDELDMGALVWLALTVCGKVGLLSCATRVLLCSAPCRATTLIHRDVKALPQDHSQGGFCSHRVIGQDSLEKQSQETCQEELATGCGCRVHIGRVTQQTGDPDAGWFDPSVSPETGNGES